MNLQELLSKKNKNEITYLDLLSTTEWKKKRKEILERDNHFCTDCGLSETLYHEGKHISFDGNQVINEIVDGNRIKADTPVTVDKKIYLHVHHQLYIMGRLPWEYENDQLTTLCNWCHWKLHQNVKIKVYEETKNGLKERELTVCSRCNGAGMFPEYSHVNNGVCFQCKGFKYYE